MCNSRPPAFRHNQELAQRCDAVSRNQASSAGHVLDLGRHDIPGLTWLLLSSVAQLDSNERD